MEQLAQFVTKSFEYNMSHSRVHDLFNSMASARLQQKLSAAVQNDSNDSNLTVRNSSVGSAVELVNDVDDESVDIDITDLSGTEDTKESLRTMKVETNKPLSLIRFTNLEKELKYTETVKMDKQNTTLTPMISKPKNWLISDSTEESRSINEERGSPAKRSRLFLNLRDEKIPSACAYESIGRKKVENAQVPI